jgi:ribonuclease BN (tRNA processing enzyme)
MPTHHGWGHSTYEESVHLALEAGAKCLLLTHHDPARTDDQVRDIVRRARELAAPHKNILRIDGAREGAGYSLPEKQARPAPRLAAVPRKESP